MRIQPVFFAIGSDFGVEVVGVHIAASGECGSQAGGRDLSRLSE
jgi:hypothetical protein